MGLGNIWRFPQVTSQNGGAAFVAFYLPLVLFIGIPLIWAELAAGQRGQGSAPRAIKEAVGGKWKWVGLMMVATSTLFLSYYTVIAGLALKYAIFSPTDIIFGADASAEAVRTATNQFLAESTQGPEALAMHLIFTAITATVVSVGVSGGIERANLIMMPTLFVIVAGLAIYGLTQPGATDGLSFYLGFEPSALSWDAATIAIGQVFFSTSVGFGIMITYGSYNDEGSSLLGSAGIIGISDTLVALVAGLMIFPLVFSLGLQGDVLDPNAGATTALFLTIPSAFGAIGGMVGKALMLIFFAMLTMAALSSSISGLEVLVSYLEEAFDVARWKLALLGAEVSYGIGILSAMDVGILGRVDALVGSVLLILGGIGICLIYTFGIGDQEGRVELLLGGTEDPSSSQVTVAKGIAFLVAYIIPVILLALLVINLDDTCVQLLGQGACSPVTSLWDGAAAFLVGLMPF